nr:CHAT domain-containing tetratricopeptide repeat protein [Wenzhouxiangella sp. XN79A]
MERAAPDSLALSAQQVNLAIVLRRMGEPDVARTLAESALAIRTRLAPQSELVAQTLNNLGVLAKNGGDLVAAEDHYRRALAIREALDAPPLARASVLGNLANLALERLDPEASLALHREVLALLEPVAPGHRYVVTTRLSLGQAELLRGRLDAAGTHLEAARTLQEAIGTEAPIYAGILEALGRLARERDQANLARELLERALALRLRLDGGGLDAASVRLALAELDLDQGRIDAARDRLRAAIETAAERAPGSLVEALAHHRLAGLAWADGQQAAGLAADAEALDAFERQRERLGGDWLQRMRFGASHRALYVDAIERRLAADRPAEAFAIQERYRAYERRRLLAGRVPLPPLDAAAPQVDELAAALGPDEAVLSWVIGADRTHAFLLTGDGPAVRTLPLGEADLQREVDALAVLLGVARPDPEQRDAFAERSQDLHRLLIAPWADGLADIKRLVLVPDQALHRLPFAALQDAADASFLVEHHALVHAASASVYVAEATQRPRPDGVVAVGDPAVDVTAAAADARAGAFGPLPSARVEVDAIAGMFPDRTLRLVGAAATESRVRAALPEAGLVHFAAHAVVDGARPLDAYVQLAHADGDRDDGRLAAWEVLSQLELDAELVTLSACRTARGRTLGGDGVLGLSQAFQLAGANAVLATLWDVPDEPTAALMAAFYRALAGGADAADALQAAQRAMLTRQRARERGWRRLLRALGGERADGGGPFDWAAFKLDGWPG